MHIRCGLRSGSGHMNCDGILQQVRQLFGRLPHFPAMPMAVASPQSATRPAATRPACLARQSPARSRHRCIIDFSVAKAGEQHRPAAGHANGFQQAANPSKVPLPLGQSSPKEEKICYHPRSTKLPNFIALPQPTPEISLTKNLADLQTVNDIGGAYPALPIGIVG